MKKLLFVLLILSKWGFSQCTSHTPTSYILTGSGGDIYHPSTSGWLPGDTLYIQAANYAVIEFINLHGDPCQKIIIKPYGGIVNITTRMKFTGDCSYVNVDGYSTNSNAKRNCGFYITGAMGCVESNHMEFHHLEQRHITDIGFFFKENPDMSNSLSIYPNYNMTKIWIDHCYIHNIHGEGMYIGHCCPDGGDTGGVIPTQMDSVEISYNLVDTTYWDGIQLSNAGYGCKIHDNVVNNYGTANNGSQQAGIIIGGRTNGNVYNNRVTNGTGNGYEAFGFGTISLYNNYGNNCGHDFTTNGQQTFFSNDYIISTGGPYASQQVIMYSNTFYHNEKVMAIKVQSDHANSNAANVHDNYVCAPNTIGSIIILDPAGSTQTNNDFSCGTPPSPPGTYSPWCSAGQDQIITLPGNTTLLGSATGNPIVNWVWSKTSGGTATVTTPNSAQTTVTGLQSGVYKFDLKVTDNNGQTARDTMQLTVNDAPVPVPTPTPIDSNQIFITYNKTNNRFEFRWNVQYATVKIIAIQYSTDGVNFSNINGWTTVKVSPSPYTKNTSYSKLYARALVLLTNGNYNYSKIQSAIKT